MTQEWWQRGIIYQIYPRSFQDSDGDGVGDLEGIAARLDHLTGLGVDALWLSPIMPSPMADFGYDVSDYCGIDPLFGGLADFDALLAAAHARDLRVILDFVPNHSSDRHPWFLASRSGRGDPRRDWYIWRDPAPDGGPPNNWLAQFAGPAWTLDAVTGQYYLHSFLPQQPDLNWRNPEVKRAMFDALRFWLERGVDGFRVDVMWLLIKDDQFRDNPPNPDYQPNERSYNSQLPLYNSNRPEMPGVVAEIRQVLDAYPDRVLIGEIYLPVKELVAYYGQDLRGANLPFNFHLILTAWQADSVAKLIVEYEAALPPGAWPNWVLGNHDQPRLATRIGAAQARVAAVLLLTLRGTPTIYYGEELGMVDVAIPAAEVRDPAELREPGRGLGRDPERTPLRWDGSGRCGFTSGTPWLPLGGVTPNVAGQQAEPGSMLTLYRHLIAVRQASVALTGGGIESVGAQGGVLSYRRTGGGERWAVCLNFTGAAQPFALPAGELVASTHADPPARDVLRPNEAAVFRL